MVFMAKKVGELLSSHNMHKIFFSVSLIEALRFLEDPVSSSQQSLPHSRKQNPFQDMFLTENIKQKCALCSQYIDDELRFQ